ncbi:cytochrome c3 family protein [Palleronia sp. KMU-117]|uniref:cytochrome c3 family protein n=1 Tax=Palleronia sp. KMU-117 TaxID=3434108 RepID=UPI003D76172A
MIHRLLLPLTTLVVLLPGLAPAGEGYVGSASCVSCHEETAEAWEGSHHALAWTWPSPETIVADFDGTVFEHDGMTARFRIEGGDYHVEVTEKDGATTDYRVHSVAGIEPLQQYLLETEPGRLQSFDVVWDTETGGWFHLYPGQDLPPDDGLHWTGHYKNWNARCAECHATGYEKNYDAQTRSYASVQAEIGVGCEACHGPGEAHLAWAEALGTTREAPTPPGYGFPQTFGTTEATIQQCATCHSRREAHDDASPLPGTPYHDSYGLALLRPGQYHADGQILDEVYVYGSFLQSKMYAKGVGCLDCHDPHRADLVADGNAVCTQCHSPAGNPDFPTLTPAEYDTRAHHFHEEGSEAAQCKSCHAPEQVYMGNDWRADHSFRVPRPDLAAVTGAPDACTTCHADKGADWAAAEIARRFPQSDNRGDHYGLTLARGRDNPVAGAGGLATLAMDADAPGIVRATAAWLLEQSESEEVAERLVPLLSDPDPLVRAAAVGVQRLAPPQDRVVRVVDLLDDPIRSVRIAAARALLDAPVARYPGRIEAAFRAAMGEWQSAMASRLDFPETHLQLAGISLTMRNLEAADRAFAEVVRMDPQRQEAWVMRVRIAAAIEGPERALAIVDEALAVLPDDLTLLGFRAELGGAPMPPDALLPPRSSTVEQP